MGVTYSKLIYGLNSKNILIDRKILSDIAISDASTFEKIVRTAVKGLKKSLIEDTNNLIVDDSNGTIHPINQVKDIFTILNSFGFERSPWP